ncbi:MAG: diaminopimelate decarboxylase, partial [Bacteroidota bacterium]
MELLNEQYCIQGIPVSEIAEQYGTPLYVYDSQKMTQQYERLTGAFDIDNLQINFACKALTNINVLK